MHSNSVRHGLLFRETWHSPTGVDEAYAMSTGEGLRMFRWNVVHLRLLTLKMKVKWPVDRTKKSQMTWIFNNTAVRISPPPTVVSKRRQETTNRRCVKSQKSADLIHTVFDAQNHATVEVLRFLSACQENAQTGVGRGVLFVVLFTCMLVISDIRKLSHNR
jgi:hypothetical protein